jgi:hypothetical protein
MLTNSFCRLYLNGHAVEGQKSIGFFKLLDVPLTQTDNFSKRFMAKTPLLASGT